ncbi:MAG: hypothetical protein IT378_17820 [Sandaracinaceae bacterium]|nr:hypothetical protein [Sandaracinaceae bacterium]
MIPLASLEVYERSVQPHVAERCGSGGCHGREERPLALYTPGAYRADPARVFLDEPLTAWELRENARRLSAMALGVRAERSVVVLKPLALEAGGLWHGGGDVFTELDDPACRVLSAWLDARTSADAGAP